MAIPQREKILTALAGEFLVAGQLCLKGYMASLTLKNYPKVDIFCLNHESGKQVAIQVKTMRGGIHYYVPEDVDNLNQPFVFVRINQNESVDYFIVPSKKVARLSEEQRRRYIEDARKKGRTVSDKQPRMINIETLNKYRDRWELLWIK